MFIKGNWKLAAEDGDEEKVRKMRRDRLELSILEVSVTLTVCYPAEIFLLHSPHLSSHTNSPFHSHWSSSSNGLLSLVEMVHTRAP